MMIVLILEVSRGSECSRSCWNCKDVLDTSSSREEWQVI